MSALQVRLFGKLSVLCDGHSVPTIGPTKVEELFCYLLLHRGRPCLREMLASLLWSNNTTAQAKAYLRRAMWQLQAALKEAQMDGADEFLLAQGDWVQCNPAYDLWLDVELFESAYARTEGIPGAALSDTDAADLERAIALYEGDLLEHCYEDWCLYERERFRHIYLVMLDKVVEHYEAEQRFEQAIALAERVLVYDHARELTHCQLMRLHYNSGNRSAALRQYQLCLEALREDFDVAPGSRTLYLYEQIRSGRPLEAHRGEAEPNGVHMPPPPAEQLLQRTLQMLAQIQQQIHQEIEFLQRHLKV